MTTEGRAHSKRGRPTRFSEEKAEAILGALRDGNHLSVAAAATGVSKSTLFRWLELGARGRSPFRDFRDRVDAARAEAEVHAVAKIRLAGDRDWRAESWWLSRSFPGRWGQPKDVPEPAGKPQGEEELDFTSSPLARALQRRPELIMRAITALRTLEVVFGPEADLRAIAASSPTTPEVKDALSILREIVRPSVTS